MKIDYSPDVDALYISLKETKIEESDEIADGVIVDYDEGGNIVGIEILSASKKADIHKLIIHAFENVMVESERVA